MLALQANVLFKVNDMFSRIKEVISIWKRVKAYKAGEAREEEDRIEEARAENYNRLYDMYKKLPDCNYDVVVFQNGMFGIMFNNPTWAKPHFLDLDGYGDAYTMDGEYFHDCLGNEADIKKALEALDQLKEYRKMRDDCTKFEILPKEMFK